MTRLQKKRKERKKQTAEDFTPRWLVNQMLDKLPKSTWEEGKEFCDPACGNGNMLIEVLKRKLSKGHQTLEALKTVYGADIMYDNVRECRLRLLKVALKQLGKSKVTKEMVQTVFQNIAHTGLDKYEKGSLDYDFSFDGSDMRGVGNWIVGINKNNWLEEVTV